MNSPWLVSLPGDFFATYRFSRGPVLGSGMSGEVVLATSRRNPSKKRAAKILSLLTADGGVKNKRLFDREVDILHRLSHPHVTRLTISAICPEYLVICTDYCTGGTLTSKLDTMSPEMCVKYFIQMTCAVRYLNDRKGIVHSDIKPDNIFINAHNNPVLGDFGLSFLIPPGRTSISTKHIGGTMCFFAPEILCRTSVDPYKLDMYSLGVVLWCMMFQTEPTSDKVYECLDDTQMMIAAPEPQGWCLANSIHHDPDIRRTAASILANMYDCDIYKGLIDRL
ncbi:unnamed protein product [Candidula unifasciata]|uniref:Protein kinase domain-containing protein n=1 Tax=Candidula unifasciata TaxID=100452 RepID=A0A8S3Z8J6_9EUPU|nr:unnamed protein product [Candidula unifasciata]